MQKWLTKSLGLPASVLLYLSLTLVQAQETPDTNTQLNTPNEEANHLELDLFDDEFVSKKYFVDKSNLLEVLFKDRHAKHFITCPSGFGKTVNLHMIRKLCQLEIDQNGAATVTPWTQSTAYKILKKTKLAQNQNISEAHVAQHPVIYLDFNCSFILESDKTVEYTMAEMNRQLWSNFRQYTSPIDQYYTAERRQNLGDDFQRWLNSSISGKIGDNFRENFRNIFLAFSTVFQGDIILLIDNHDYHVNPKFKNIQRRIESAQKLLHDVLIDTIRTYKDRLYLLMTGISAISFYKHKLHDFVEHFNFVDDTKYAPYFGLLEPELEDLFERYRTQESERIYIRKYYDSYKNSLHRYNTFHITNYFASREKKSSTTSSVTLHSSENRPNQTTDYMVLFLKHPNYLEDVAKLLKHCSIADSFNKTYNVGDLQRFDDLSRKHFNNIRSQDIRFLYTMSYEHGFIGRAKDGSYIIPNYKTRTLFEADLGLYFETTLNINFTQLGLEFLDILYKTANRTGNISDQLKTLLSPVYQKLYPIVNMGPSRIMNFTYHSILYMIAATKNELTVVDDYPQPITYHQTDENLNRRCVTLVTGASVAVIFKITHDQSAKIAMEQAITYAYQNPAIKYLKYVGINVDSYGLLDINHCPKSYLLEKGEKPVSEEIEKFTINFESEFFKQEGEQPQPEQEQQPPQNEE